MREKPPSARHWRNMRNQARQYGLSIEELIAMYEAQNGLCYICLRANQQLNVDHRHCDGLVRGLLCTRCNYQLLGVLGEDPAMYEAAADYLRNPPAIRAIGPARVPDSPPPGACPHDYH